MVLSPRRAVVGPVVGPDHVTLWNVLLSLVGVGLSTVIGVLYVKIDNQEKVQAAVQATLFTNSDAASLRADITITLSEIDKRLALMQSDAVWLQRLLDSRGGVLLDGDDEAAMVEPVDPGVGETVMVDEPREPFVPNIISIPDVDGLSTIQQEPVYDLRTKKENPL